MRTMFIILLIALVGLQYKLWLGEGNILEWKNLEKKLAVYSQENEKVTARNQAIEANIIELKKGDQALEEEARFELGMIKQDEIYYHFIE